MKPSEVRRYVAVLQAREGYPPVGLPLPKDQIPEPVELVSVVRESDYQELERRYDQAREALKPFVVIGETANALGHEPGSSCTWRVSYDDLTAARETLNEGRNP